MDGRAVKSFNRERKSARGKQAKKEEGGEGNQKGDFSAVNSVLEREDAWVNRKEGCKGEKNEIISVWGKRKKEKKQFRASGLNERVIFHKRRCGKWGERPAIYPLLKKPGERKRQGRTLKLVDWFGPIASSILVKN